MKKYLLPKDGQFYKANLHCHTTCSDGKHTAAEIKEIYQKEGYSIVAFTDHSVLVPHQDVTDENFLALNGCELECNQKGTIDWRLMKTCHVCCIALEPDNIYQVCYADKYLSPYQLERKHILAFDKERPDFERVYSHEGISAMIQEARNRGFFVTYNHPGTNLEHYPDYIGYKNMNAIELHNTAGVRDGFYDYCPETYDDLLRAGNKIYAIAGDDTHAADWCFDKQVRGYTMIKAAKLEYRAVTNALVNGHFYVSQGPVIDELWFEDGVIHLKTPGADRIVFTVGNRRDYKSYIAKDGVSIKEAEFEIKPDQSYVRATIYDEYGHAANTNAFFIEDLLK